MGQDELRNAVEGIRAHLQAELEAQLTALHRKQQDAVEAARRAADADAHERWSIQLEQVRADWQSRLETELAAAAADADRRTVAECTRARLETEQGAAESIARIRQQAAADLERARADADTLIAEERQRAQTEIASALARADAVEQERDRERQRAQTLERDLGAVRQELEDMQRELESGREQWQSSVEEERVRRRQIDDELQGVRRALATAEQERDASIAAAAAAAEQAASAGALTEARVEERQSQLAVVERLFNSVRAIGEAASLSDVLATLVAGAAGEVPRAALFIVNADALQGFRVSGFDESVVNLSVPLQQPDGSALVARGESQGSALQEAISRGDAVSATPANAPSFAGLAEDRAGLAVPLLVGGRPVAVLYADDMSEGEPTAPASWPEAVQILCRHASVALGHLTALRTAQLLRQPHRHAGGGLQVSSSASNQEDQAARRYAKLLVSEIKLYNEAAVRMGREKRDLLTRLKPEVERAKRLYEERVPAAVVARGMYFQQELVQTLADGDPTLLGHPSVPS